MRSQTLPVVYRVAWLLLAVAFVSAFLIWGTRIDGSLRAAPTPIQTPVPRATAAPQIATVYSNIGPPDPVTLCSEISPTPRVVTVESTTGVVIATVQCSH